MAFSLTPSKRPFQPNPSESKVRGKWRKTAPSSQQAPLKVSPGAVVFRILCPGSKSGSVIGKGGSIITRIRQETSARVKLEEIASGCEERVVVITGSDKNDESSNEHVKEGNQDNGGTYGAEDDKGNSEKDEQKGVETVEVKDEHSVSEVPKREKGTSSAQKALLLVFERIIADEPENGDGDGDEESAVTVRLLIFASQVDCLLGKGGSVIKQMSSDSGAEIQILAKDKIPLCALPHDEVVQITGVVDSAKKALQSVSQHLLENPPHESFTVANPPGPSSNPFASISKPEVISSANSVPIQRPPFSNRAYGSSDIPTPFMKFHESVASGQIAGLPEKLIFRLLCSNDKVGSVIGKGGSIVKCLQHETGCEIKVLDITPESDDRLIIISGPELPGARISPAQDGVLRVQHRIVMADDTESNVLSRLLISADQTGCLLGKGGGVIAEMRKLTGAHIRVLSKDQIPKYLPENDAVVQITGGFAAVQEALLQITGRLRINLFHDKIPGMGHAGKPAFVDQWPPFGPYMGKKEPSPTRMFPNLPPFQREIGGRLQDERSAFAYPLHGSGFPPHGSERLPVPWAAEGTREGAGSMPISEYVGGIPQRRIGFACRNQATVITNTTMDVIVPRALVPAIYGEDGYCLRRIREISEAKITITEPRPEATETVIVISGTPEQTHAAQSLLQAFVLSETCTS